MEKMIGGRLAAEALIERGVKYIFSISGGHITPIYEFLENTSVKIFSTRHEQAAVFMAEAMARMTRKPAVVMVTAGPGFTNAVTGIAAARLSNAPVILISGIVGLEMVEKLVQVGKQFDMQFYPDKNHGIYGGNTTMHLYTMLSEYVFNNL